MTATAPDGAAASRLSDGPLECVPHLSLDRSSIAPTAAAAASMRHSASGSFTASLSLVMDGSQSCDTPYPNQVTPHFSMATPGTSVPPTPFHTAVPPRLLASALPTPQHAPTRASHADASFSGFAPFEIPAPEIVTHSPTASGHGSTTTSDDADAPCPASRSSSRCESPGPFAVLQLDAALLDDSDVDGWGADSVGDDDDNGGEGSCEDNAASAPPRGSAASVMKLPEVAPGVRVGSYADACDMAATDAAGVRAFACVADNVGAMPFPAHGLVHGTRQLLIPVADRATTQLADHVPRLLHFADAATTAGMPLVVYCRYGISRSVAFVLVLVMHRLQLPLDRALDHVRRVYPKADPNFAFVCQLRDLEPMLLLNSAAGGGDCSDGRGL